jgi:hypothetical protein
VNTQTSHSLLSHSHSVACDVIEIVLVVVVVMVMVTPSIFLLLTFTCFLCRASAEVSWIHSRSSSMCHFSTPSSSSPSPLAGGLGIEEINPFIRNCSASDSLRPLVLPTPADIEALGHVLQNRTLAFIGDSTTQAQVN